MGLFCLTCSSAADLPPEYLRARWIPCVPYAYSLLSKQYWDDGWVSFGRREFYERLSSGAVTGEPKAHIATYFEVFERLLASGYDVLHLEASSRLTTAAAAAAAAQRELSQRYPARTLHIMDTQSISGGMALLVDAAANLRDEGATLHETHARIEAMRGDICHLFATRDMGFLGRSERISSLRATLGRVSAAYLAASLNASDGWQESMRMGGRTGMLRELLYQMEIGARGGLNYSGPCIIAHSGQRAQAEAFAQQVRERFEKLEEPPVLRDLGPVVSALLGSGAYGLFFQGGGDYYPPDPD